jgi:hypothetical protein
MKTMKIIAILVLAVVVGQGSLSSAAPMGTAWTYQGRLMDTNVPADGVFEFQFELYDSPEDGNQLDNTFSLRAVDVIDGYFTVELDFGGGVFDGDARWLEIGVRPSNTADPFNILSPRQKLTPTPYSLYADTANSASYAETAGSTVGGIEGNGTAGYVARFTALETIGNSAIYNNGSSVGIGTTNPNSRLHIWKPSSSSPVLQLDTQKIVGPLTLIYKLLFDGTSIDAEGTLGDLPISLNPNSSGDVFLAGGGGQVGIGTTSPAAKLHVAGMARVEAVQITGADVAEKFPVSEEVKPGMVVAIDPENPGKLCLSRSAYNRCVAGVVSGANGLPVGAVLGNLPGQEDAMPIALSGRVWVYCDATDHPVEVGDLLTTAERIGHARAVTDYERAHGAVIGKAMTGLQNEKSGLVLALVNLQ